MKFSEPYKLVITTCKPKYEKSKYVLSFEKLAPRKSFKYFIIRIVPCCITDSTKFNNLLMIRNFEKKLSIRYRCTLSIRYLTFLNLVNLSTNRLKLFYNDICMRLKNCLFKIF